MGDKRVGAHVALDFVLVCALPNNGVARDVASLVCRMHAQQVRDKQQQPST